MAAIQTVVVGELSENAVPGQPWTTKRSKNCEFKLKCVVGKSLERMWVLFFDIASSGFLKVSCKVKSEITPRSVCKFFTKFF